MRGLCAAALVLAVLAASACGEDDPRADIPDADELPLAPGLAVTESKPHPSGVVSGDYYRALVVESPSTDETGLDIIKAEVAYLEERGWRIWHQRTQEAKGESPVGLYAFIGFCWDRGKSDRQPEGQRACVAVS